MSEKEAIADLLAAWQERREAGDTEEARRLLSEHPELAVHVAAADLLGRGLAARNDAPRRIGDFEIVREIGRGGMGVVYEAVQSSMGRRVALKILSPSFTGAPQAAKRFQREARAAGRLHHTNIVPIHALGQHEGHWYYAMELVQGRPLSDVVAELRAQGGRPTEESLAGQGPRTPPTSLTDTGDRSYFARVAQIFSGVAEALDLAHHEGVIHRDIKPSNLLLDADGTLKIVDFGLARTDADGPSMTITGDLLGTPAYMSPEQAMAKRIDVDHRTDVYSLGATLYEMLTLRPPFEGRSLQELCSRIITKDPALPQSRNRRVPRDLETIVLKAMEKDRDKRYQTAGELARDLRRFADGAAVHARRTGPLGRAWRRLRRRPRMPALAVAASLLAAAVVFLAVRAAREADRRREAEYQRLLAQAEEEFGPSVPRFFSEFDAHIADGARVRDLLARAVLLAPERPEASWLLALAPVRTLAERFEALDQSLRRGLSRRTYHLTRAHLLGARNRWKEAEAERRAADAWAASADDAYFEARLAAARPEEELRLLDRAIEGAGTRRALRYLALRRRAEVRGLRGDLRGALEDLYALQALGDASVRVSVHAASVWRRLGEEETAEKAFAQCLADARARREPDRWLTLCLACGLYGETAWHARISEEAVSEFPDVPDLLVQLSRTKEGNERLALADRALLIAPNHHRAHEAKGEELLRLGRYEEARAAFDRAVALDPACPSARAGRGRALFELGKTEEAMADLDRAVALEPDHADNYDRRGWALRRLGKFDAARADLERALAIGDHQWTRNEMGILLMDEHKPEEALAQYDRALAPSPDFAPAHNNRGNALAALGRNEEALAASTEAVRLDPTEANYYLGLGTANLKLGRLDEAVAATRRATELDPKMGKAFNNLAYLLRRLGRHAEAVEAADRAIALGVGDVAHYNKGRALHDLGRDAEALEAYERGLEVAPGEPNLLEKKGYELVVLGRETEALAVLRELRGRGLHGEALTVAEASPRFVHLEVACLRALDDAPEARAKALAALRRDDLPQAARAYLLAVAGERERAAEALARAGPAEAAEDLHDRARVHALLGDREQALELLEAAVARGLRRPAPDPDLDALAGSERYEAAVRRLTSRGE